MIATIKQIAEELGLHPSTVSRALSGYEYVAESTREKVLQKAKQYGYTPNLWAQNLVNSTTNIIGCMVLELTNPFYIPIVRAIEDIADQKGYITFIGESRRNLKTEIHMIERLRRIRASGVIITPVLSNLDHLKNLENDGVPVVIAGRNIKSLDSINVDNVRSGNIAGQYLFQQGYKKFGYVQSGDEFNFPEKDRLFGYTETLIENGINLSTVYTVGNNNITGGEKAGDLWLLDKNRPDAVFCSNDLLAMGFIQSIVKLGIQVPGDVAVIGHDDIPFADNFIISLTSVSFNKYELGQMAINLLFERISSTDSPHEPTTVLLEPDLVIRNSCP